MALRIDGTLLLAGAGNMGLAMLAGWLERGLDPKCIVVQDPNPPPRARELIQEHGIDLRPAVGSMREPPAVLVVAVKPQAMDAVFPRW
jgi:pyrroline-5-carboxylate reductase